VSVIEHLKFIKQRIKITA